MEGGREVIRLERLSTSYEGERIPAIRDIDLTVSQGDFVCIVGPNGSGKTTLLETINGILRYTSGRGSVFGLDITRNGSAIRRRVGYVIQNFEVDPLSPFLCRNVVMSGRTGKIGLLRFPGPKDWDVVRSSMGQVGMDSYWTRPVGKLSGGEFQKILLARALAQEPDIFLLDEPFANLDLRSKLEVDRLLSEVHASGSTMLMVSHEVNSIPQSCTHIVVMDRGRMIRKGSRDEVVKSGVIGEVLSMRRSAR
jgi:zinc/manganese transport system ATP-binding protein